MRKIYILGTAAMLAACDSGASNSSEKTENSRPTFAEVTEIASGAMFASFDVKLGYSAMQDAAKSACGSEDICKIIIFPIGTVLPTQFPMTDREVAQSVGNYTLNRNTGADELLARCPAVGDTPAEKCMAAE